jgi:hypothetical protein
MEKKTRRRFLTLAGASASFSAAGCLRLSGSETGTPQNATDNSSGDQSPTPDSSGDQSSTPNDRSNEVTLTENWTDENGVDNIWTREGTFYYNDYNYAAEASPYDGVAWSADTTHEGVDENLGDDAFAADGRYVVFGYTPNGEHEDDGAHFHTYRRYDGEEVWAVSAPSDGTHNAAEGATLVDDIAVLAISDYGEGDERDPLVYGVDIETGETRWQADESVLPAAYIRYLGSYDGDVYLGTTEGMQVLASETGELIETHDSWYIGTSRLESLGEMHGGNAVCGGGRDHRRASAR